MDLAEIRRRNLLHAPSITVNGLRVQSYGLPECIDEVVTRSRWSERKGKLPRGRGLGIACSHYVSGAANSIICSDMPHSTVNIKIDRDGGVVIYTGASDIGQGSDTMVAQIAAEVLGCTMGRVKVIAADTDLTPIDIGSYSSRVTFMNGNATKRAAEAVKKQIVSAAAGKMACTPEDVDARRSRVEEICKRKWQWERRARSSCRDSNRTNRERPRGRANSARIRAAKRKRRPEGSDVFRRSGSRRD